MIAVISYTKILQRNILSPGETGTWLCWNIFEKIIFDSKGKDIFPRVLTWDTSNENKNVIRFDAQEQKTIRKPSKGGINLFTQETGITRSTNNEENSERKMAVCLPLSPWQTVSNEWSQGGNEANCRCSWQTQYQIKYWSC